MAAAVLLLHLGMLLFWTQATLRQQQAGPAVAEVVTLLSLLPLPLPARQPAPARPEPPPRAGPAAGKPVSPGLPPRRSTPAATAPATTFPSAAAPTSVQAEPVPAAPQPAQAAASQAPPSRPLLDTDATRRAIRSAARERSTTDLLQEASGAKAALRPDERLGQDIGKSAIGDCLKGEYFGAGGGLLSLPFWLAAELREKCRR